MYPTQTLITQQDSTHHTPSDAMAPDLATIAHPLPPKKSC